MDRRPVKGFDYNVPAPKKKRRLPAHPGSTNPERSNPRRNQHLRGTHQTGLADINLTHESLTIHTCNLRYLHTPQNDKYA